MPNSTSRCKWLSPTPHEVSGFPWLLVQTVLCEEPPMAPLFPQRLPSWSRCRPKRSHLQAQTGEVLNVNLALNSWAMPTTSPLNPPDTRCYAALPSWHIPGPDGSYSPSTVPSSGAPTQNIPYIPALIILWFLTLKSDGWSRRFSSRLAQIMSSQMWTSRDSAPFYPVHTLLGFGILIAFKGRGVCSDWEITHNMEHSFLNISIFKYFLRHWKTMVGKKT